MADRKGKHSHFWYQIFLFYKQLEGIEVGFKNGVKRSRNEFEIPSTDFLLLNAAVDIRDLKIYYKQIVNNASSIDLAENKEQILLKILNNEGYIKLFLGHTSDGSDGKQLRMLKKYTFRYHFSRERESKIIPGTNIIFTGYPGVAASLDDFYLTLGKRQRLIVSGVKMKNRNLTLWTDAVLENSIFLAPRSMAANRLAHNGRSWAKFMAKSPTTGSKQWLVIDSKHLDNLETENVDEDYNYTDEDINEFQKSVSEIKSDGSLFWIVDQIPGRLHAEDVTQKILMDGFWRSEGVPYFEVSLENNWSFEQFNILTPLKRTNNLLMKVFPKILSLTSCKWLGWDLERKNQTFFFNSIFLYLQELRKISQVEPNPQINLANSLGNITDLNSLAKVLKLNEFRGSLDKEHLEMKLICETNNNTAEFRAYSGPAFGQISDSDDVTEIEIEPFSWDSIKEIGNDDDTDVWSFSQISPRWAWI